MLEAFGFYDDSWGQEVMAIRCEKAFMGAASRLHDAENAMVKAEQEATY